MSPPLRALRALLAAALFLVAAGCAGNPAPPPAGDGSPTPLPEGNTIIVGGPADAEGGSSGAPSAPANETEDGGSGEEAAGTSPGDEGGASSGEGGEEPAAPTQEPAAAEPRRVPVAIEDDRFSPATIEIRPGDTVVWTNRDDSRHTATAGDNSWHSGSMAEGATFERTFDEPGRYAYVCAFHSKMRGVVNVVAA